MKLSRENLRILVVDDDETDWDLIRATLVKAGFTHPINHLSNGEKTLEYLESAKAAGSPVPHIILLDLNMPVIDGVHALHRLREASSFSDVPVVIVSGDDDPAKRREVAHLGIFRFVKKLPNGANVISALDDFLGFYNHVASAAPE